MLTTKQSILEINQPCLKYSCDVKYSYDACSPAQLAKKLVVITAVAIVLKTGNLVMRCKLPHGIGVIASFYEGKRRKTFQ